MNRSGPSAPAKPVNRKKPTGSVVSIRNWVGYPNLTIQYGGSVKPGNIDELMAKSDITACWWW